MSGRGGLEARLGYRFRDAGLLEQALRHRSYANEHDVDPLECNERLEFLGDAIVGALAARMAYERHPQRDEGWLTDARSRLVRNETLGRLSGGLGIGAHLEMGAGIERDGGRERPVVLARALEAVIGAIWLDGGDEAARAFVERLLADELEELEREGAVGNPKSRLQELMQAERGATPRYAMVSTAGPDHDRSFTVMAMLCGEEIAQGTGKSKQAAEMAAAAAALERLEARPAADGRG